MGKQKVTVKLNEPNPEAVEVIADAIIKVSEAFKRISQSRLTRRAIICLIYDACPTTSNRGKPPKYEIEAVLDTAERLKDIYIKKLMKDS